jgi:hypothetical protein
MPEHDELDLQIQQALTSYADPGRESGLEERILAKIAAESVHAPLRRWLPWAIALPIAAGLMVLLLLSAHRKAAPTQADHLRAPLAQQTEVADVDRRALTAPRPTQREKAGGELGPSRARESITATTATPLPKLDVFPMPQPLSPEEQALAVFAARASEAERQSLIKSREQSDAPIRIAAIEIQPLNPLGNGGN